MNIYIYLLLILSLIFLTYELVTSSFKYCPIKIKEVTIISFCLIIFRLCSLLVLLLADDIKIIYLVKNLVFFNIIYIPIIIYTCLYVFYRNTIMNIKWFYGVFAIGLFIYLMCIFKIPMEYYISLSYGYNVVLTSMLPYKILLCVNGLSFFMCIKSYRYKHSIKWGTILIGIASLIFIGTTEIALRSSENLGYLLIGDLSWIIVLYGSVRTFKNKIIKDKR